jgi:hypothetical protein
VRGASGARARCGTRQRSGGQESQRASRGRAEGEQRGRQRDRPTGHTWPFIPPAGACGACCAPASARATQRSNLPMRSCGLRAASSMRGHQNKRQTLSPLRESCPASLRQQPRPGDATATDRHKHRPTTLGRTRGRARPRGPEPRHTPDPHATNATNAAVGVCPPVQRTSGPLAAAPAVRDRSPSPIQLPLPTHVTHTSECFLGSERVFCAQSRKIFQARRCYH